MTLRSRWEDAASILEKAMTEAEKAADCCRIAKKLAEICNQLGSKSESQLPKYLKTAETALLKAANARKREGVEADEALLRSMLLTYNNLSTFHKGKRSYHMALNYLMKALRLLDDLPPSPSPDTLQYSAKTRLNISALYADIHSYPEAISHAEQCLSTLQQELNSRLNGRLLEHLSSPEREKFETMITTYVVAFYNIGVAEEAMGQGGNAAKAYRNAVKIGAKFLPPGSQELALARAALKMPPEHIQSARTIKPIPAEDYRLMLITQLHDLGDVSPIDQSQRVTQMETMTGTTSKANKEPFKYYSPERLASLHARLTKGEKVEFVSADDYFLSRITANLDVASDIKYMRPLSAYGLNSAETAKVRKGAEKERRLMSDLRQRRHPHRLAAEVQRGKDHVLKHIERIDAELDAQKKRNEVRLLSRSSRSKSHQHLHSPELSVPKAPVYPPQSRARQDCISEWMEYGVLLRLPVPRLEPLLLSL